MLGTYTSINILKYWAQKLKSLIRRAIFWNTKEILKNTKENQYLICFSHCLLYNYIIYLQLIYIFPLLKQDSLLGHIYGHMSEWPFSRNGHKVHYGLTKYGHGYGQVGCLFNDIENWCEIKLITTLDKKQWQTKLDTNFPLYFS